MLPYDACGRIQLDVASSAYEPAHYKLYEYDQYGQLIGEENEGLAKNYFYSYNNNGKSIQTLAVVALACVGVYQLINGMQPTAFLYVL